LGEFDGAEMLAPVHPGGEAPALLPLGCGSRREHDEVAFEVQHVAVVGALEGYGRHTTAGLADELLRHGALDLDS
jgi:hypothetical protein